MKGSARDAVACAERDGQRDGEAEKKQSGAHAG